MLSRKREKKEPLDCICYRHHGDPEGAEDNTDLDHIERGDAEELRDLESLVRRAEGGEVTATAKHV